MTLPLAGCLFKRDKLHKSHNFNSQFTFSQLLGLCLLQQGMWCCQAHHLLVPHHFIINPRLSWWAFASCGVSWSCIAPLFGLASWCCCCHCTGTEPEIQLKHGGKYFWEIQYCWHWHCFWYWYQSGQKYCCEKHRWKLKIQLRSTHIFIENTVDKYCCPMSIHFHWVAIARQPLAFCGSLCSDQVTACICYVMLINWIALTK